MKNDKLSNAGDDGFRPMVTRPKRSRASQVYLALWLLLAAGALAYLAGLALAPERLVAILGTEKPVTAESNETAEVEAPAPASLVGDVEELRNELQQLRGEVRTLVATNQTLADRLETIETASIRVQPEGSEAVPISQGKTKKSTAPDDSDISGVIIGQDDYASEDIAGLSSEGAESTKKSKKSEARAAAEPKTEVASAAPAAEIKKKRFGLELAVSTSPEALQLNWDLLNERHGALLKGLSARALPSPVDPTSYRLVAGPITNAQQAQSLCAKLKKQNIACSVTEFGGDSG
ncbi:MAG: SPOR domain-containing protein [Hyphomicrobiaceae bacterium]